MLQGGDCGVQEGLNLIRVIALDRATIKPSDGLIESFLSKVCQGRYFVPGLLDRGCFDPLTQLCGDTLVMVLGLGRPIETGRSA